MEKIASLKTLLNTLLFLALLTFSHCGDDDQLQSTFTYTIDGEEQPVATMIGILAFDTQYDHEGRAMYITAANGTTQMLSIAVSNWDFQNPPDNGILEQEYDAAFDFESNEDNPLAECLELTGNNAGVFLCEGGLVTYITDTDEYFSVFGDNPEGIITITHCNTSALTISGTFTTKVQNDLEEELTIVGNFEKVRYFVQ